MNNKPLRGVEIDGITIHADGKPVSESDLVIQEYGETVHFMFFNSHGECVEFVFTTEQWRVMYEFGSNTSTTE